MRDFIGPEETFGLLLCAQHMRPIDVVSYTKSFLGFKLVVENRVKVGEA